MWAFLSSEFLFFGALITNYLLYLERGLRQGADAGRDLRHPLHLGELLRPPDELADDGAGPQRPSPRRPGCRPAPGCSRLPCSDRSSWPVRSSSSPSSSRSRDMTLRTNPAASAFYVLTGFHGTHVAIGVIMLLSLFGLSKRMGGLTDKPVPQPGTGRPLLALRRHHLDRDLHRGLPAHCGTGGG